MAEREVVACLGSSTTAGRGQAFDWIGELARRPQNARFAFRNFGVGGDLAMNALARVDDVVASRPDRVIVIIGSNDILATVFPFLRRIYRVTKGLRDRPSAARFEADLTAIVRRLKAETHAAIALASLAEVGEAPQSSDPAQAALNRLYAEYRGIVQRVAAEESATYLPLYEAFHAALFAESGRAFSHFNPLPFYRDTFRFFVRHWSGDEIAEANGWRFHVDGVHLNRRGATILMDVVQAFLDVPRSALGAADQDAGDEHEQAADHDL